MAKPDPGDSNMMDEAGSSTAPVVESYPILVPKDHNKKLSIMRFNASLGIDFTNWTEPKLERENNEIQFRSLNKEMPKSGEGSEYGREVREEARRKWYDSRKKYKPEEQPWLLEYGGKDGEKLRGVREGGVTENASYYMLTPSGTNGSFDAFPVSEWYTFHPVQTCKDLDHEKVDEFNNARDKAYTRFKMMLRKKMTTGEDNDEDDDGDDEDGAGKRKGKKKGQKGDSCNCDDVDETADSSGDSDEDDGEGRREFDDTSSSDFESEPDEDSEEENENEDTEEENENGDTEEENENEDTEEENENEDTEEDEDDGEEMDDKGPMFDNKSDKKKKSCPKNGKKSTKEDFGSSTLKDISTAEREKAKSSPKPKSANNSQSATPKKFAAAAAGASSSGRKRKSGTDAGEGSSGRSATKRRHDLSNSSSADSSPAAKSSAKKLVNEDSIRRYLQRKPMTTKELIEKFKSKKTGLSENQLVRDISQTLKKMNLGKGTTRGDMRLSLLDE